MLLFMREISNQEGQLLIDKILKHFNFQGKIQRILINVKDDESLKYAFAQIVDNEQFKNLYYAR